MRASGAVVMLGGRLPPRQIKEQTARSWRRRQEVKDSVCCQTETRSNYGAESGSICFHGFHQALVIRRLLLKYAITCSNYSFHCITLCCHCNTAVGGGGGHGDSFVSATVSLISVSKMADGENVDLSPVLDKSLILLGEACPSPASILVPPPHPNHRLKLKLKATKTKKNY